MKFFKLAGVFLTICFLTGCASPPKPASVHGEYHPVNNFSDLGKISTGQNEKDHQGQKANEK